MKPALTREEMILSLRPSISFHVRSAAGRYHLEPSVIEDIEAVAWCAAISAVDSFDAARNVLLKTWADRRIRGSILDWFRENDPLPRSERKKVQAGEAKAPRFISMDGLHLLATTRENAQTEAAVIVAKLLAKAKLNPRQMHVIRRHILEDIELKRVGAELGVVESRASQIKLAALAKLRLAAAA